MSRIRVLLADDCRRFRTFLRSLLVQEPQVEVVGEAGNGHEAIRRTREQHPDVVLMDVVMPQLDGIQATREIRALHPSVEIIALSAHDERAFVDAMLEAGASAYLLKGEELPSLVRAILAASSAGCAASR